MTEAGPAGAADTLLSVHGLGAGYGAVAVLHGIDLHVRQGEIVALLGSNGAGKTTTLAAITGQLSPTAGVIRLRGEAIAGVRPERLVARGISLVPEGRHIVPLFTVQENLLLGAFLRRDAEIDADIARMLDVFPRLRERFRQPAGLLSGGEQQMLAVARAVMARPALLLLDEPSMGLAPIIVETIFQVLTDLNRAGTTMMLVEQNARLALQLAHRAYVLEQGRISLSGSAAEIAAAPAIIDAYLGRQGAA